jgi:APA family basic amino acid/polyamine antiporter
MNEPALASSSKPLGFWACWSLTVGVMIGSGVFALPAVLAPYGLLSFGGWVLTGAGSILLALTIGRLASRTTLSGGPYIYAREAFGDLAGFLIGWGYWTSYWIAIPAVAIAFVGYLTVFFPSLSGDPLGQAIAGLALIWALTLLAVRGVREAGIAQVAMTLLKLAPLLVVVALGAVVGRAENLPEFNPQGGPIVPALAASALLTLWAFSGLEAGCLPARDVKDPERTIPRAVVIGTVTVTLIYLAATAAVMLLVPAGQLAQSTSPFADAAGALGPWGPSLIAAGALVATAGALNGIIFIAGQLPMAVALDGLAPAAFARRNGGGSPQVSLIVSSLLGSILLLANYSRGLIGAFEFLALMATLATLAPLIVSAAAEIKHSWRDAKGWAAIALISGVYCVFAAIGSGWEVLAWGVLLFHAGLPVYLLMRGKAIAGSAPAS